MKRQKSRKDSEIRRLCAENNKLKKENNRLRHSLNYFTAASSLPTAPTTMFPNGKKASRLWQNAFQNTRLTMGKNYPHFLWQSFHATDFYHRYVHFLTNFRRYRLVSRLVTITAALIAFLGTGAAILLGLILALLLVPVFLLSVGGTALLGLFTRPSHRQALRKTLTQCKRVIICIPPVLSRQASFLEGQIQEWAKQPGTGVFVVSPYAWLTRGLGGRGFYTNMRTENPGVYLLRRHFFYVLRHLLSEYALPLIVMY